MPPRPLFGPAWRSCHWLVAALCFCLFTWLAFRGDEYEFSRSLGVEYTTDAAIGLVIWAVAAGVVYARAGRRLRALAHRQPSGCPTWPPQMVAEYPLAGTRRCGKAR